MRAGVVAPFIVCACWCGGAIHCVAALLRCRLWSRKSGVQCFEAAVGRSAWLLDKQGARGFHHARALPPLLFSSRAGGDGRLPAHAAARCCCLM